MTTVPPLRHAKVNPWPDYGTSQHNQTGPIAFQQDNHFSNNTYSGPWHFWAWSQSTLANPVTWAEWTAPATDRCGTAGEISSSTCSSVFGQDAGSTLGCARDSSLYQGRSAALQSHTGCVAARVTSK
jgi:hypothetical protein